MSELLAATILLGYGSLALELTVLHVPSVASSRTIWNRPGALAAAYSPFYRRLFELSRPMKLLVFMLPVLVIYAVYLYPLVTIVGPRDPLGDQVFAPSIVSQVFAVLLILTGRAVTLASVLAIRKCSGSAAAEADLRTDGPFRRSRNPGLVGMYLFVSGLWLAGPSLAMLLGIVVYALHMDFKVRMEEDYLQNRFRETYAVYRRRTSRYWP